MSVFARDFEEADGMFVEGFGDTITYKPAGSEQKDWVDVQAIVGSEKTVESVEQDGVKRRHVRSCEIPATVDAARGGTFIAEVVLHDTFDFEGVGYLIKSITKTPSLTIVEAERIATHAATRDGMRRRN